MIKAEIIQVGYVDENNEPQNWFFDCKNTSIPAITITENGFLYAGYSIEELKSISILH